MRATKGRPYDSSSIVGERWKNVLHYDLRLKMPVTASDRANSVRPYIMLTQKKDSTLEKMLSFFYIHMGLSFHFPELYRVWLKLAAATKIMDSACEKLLCLTAACVKVSCERLIVSVYCNKDTLTLELTLDYTLLIGKNRYFDRAIA